MKIDLVKFENVFQWRKATFSREKEYGFALVESGKIFFKSDTDVYYVSENEAMSFVPGKEYTRIINEGKAKIHYFTYNSSYLLFPEGKIVFKDTEHIKKTIELLNKVEEIESADKYFCKKNLFCNLYINYLVENIGRKNLVARDDVIFEIKEYLDEFFDNKISFSAIAKKYHFSYSQFFRRFKAAVGVSPEDYLFSVRMERAKSLLVNTHTLMRTVAETCGFSDEFYFSKAFKKKYNMSPSKYRKEFSN